jgi:hypothetical protein
LKQKSYKKSGNKPRLSLIPKSAIWAMGMGFTHGVKKHGEHRYRQDGINISELIDSTLRHVEQFNSGEDIDIDSGNLHLGNAMCNLAMIIELMEIKPECDDRFKKKKGIK